MPRARTAVEALDSEIESLNKERESLDLEVEKLRAHIMERETRLDALVARQDEVASLVAARQHAQRLLNGMTEGATFVSEEPQTVQTEKVIEAVPVNEVADDAEFTVEDDEEDEPPQSMPRVPQEPVLVNE